MPRPITQKQLTAFWAENFSPTHLCCLCGNKGVVDTRGKVFSAAGVDAGALVYCLCPNGRAQKRASIPL